MEDPFVHTGKNSDKIFQYADGNLAAASKVKELPMEVREPAKDVHIVRGINSNLINTGKFIDANYAWVFDNDEVGIYDKTNTKIITTRAAVLKGWRSPHDNLWHIPLVKPGKSVAEGTEDIIAVAQSPQEILRSQPVGAPEELYNVYELKTKPELVRFYHAAAGFPTKPTWLEAIRNNHYASWPGLNAKDVAKYFPESEEMWKGHGRKIRAGLRSTKAKAPKKPTPQETPPSAVDPPE